MIITRFEEIVKKHGASTAIVTEGGSITYAQLNRYANRAARQLLSACGDSIENTRRPDQRAALFFHHGTNMITGILAALKAGSIYVPLDVSYPEKRLAYLLADSDSRVVLTDSENMPLAVRLAEQAQEKNQPLAVVNIDAAELDENTSMENIPQNPSGERAAYILYTSGSTGNPKGVVQNHSNVWYYVRNWIQQFSITPSDRLTLFSAFTHDGAGQDMFAALLSGAVLYPRNIRKDADTLELADWIIENRITHWHSVPTLFRHFTNTLKLKANPGEKQFPDLRYIFLGGETLREDDFKLWQQFFPNTYFANVYGQTESSVNSIWMIPPGSESFDFDKVLIGEPLDRTELLIVDKGGGVMEDFGVGEIFVACDHIALEYWRDEEKSQKVFLRDPQLGRLFRTGDLGRLISEGNIEILGRKDFQIKIRGHRVELGEIESALLTHSKVKEAAVAAWNTDADTYLSAYIVPSGDMMASGSELRDFLSRELPDFMVPSRFIMLEKMPLTSSNKIDRKSLPEPPPLTTASEAVKPRNSVEETLAGIWATVLAMDKESFGIDDNYFEIGGHSLKATLMASLIKKELNAEVPLTEIFDKPTIRQLAEFIVAMTGKQFAQITPAAKKDFYVLSPAQKRMYVLHQMDPQRTTYNLPFISTLEGHLDIEKVEQTFSALIQRHESFRTLFYIIDEEPVQQIQAAVSFTLEFYKAGSMDVECFIRPFDLSRAPLLRVGLLEQEPGKHVLMIDMHHIIADGTSAGILEKEFMSLYHGQELPKLRIQYKDYAEWQTGAAHREHIARQEQYWLKHFEGEIPVLNLPLDYHRPATQDFSGENVPFEIDSLKTAQLRELAAQQDATLYMVLLALVNVFLAKLSGQEDIVVGTPVMGRNHADVHDVMGMFVNTLALRNYPEAEKLFSEFIWEVKESALQGFENQDYSFEDLVEQADVQRDISRNPLFDVLFELQNVQRHEVEIDGLTSSPYEFEYKISKFDLIFQAIEKDDKLLVITRYCSALFNEETIQRFNRYFKEILRSVTVDPHLEISDIRMLPEDEKLMILETFNKTDTKSGFGESATIHELFAQQAARTPDVVVAVTPGEQSLTYKDLDQLADDLAHRLWEKGTGPGTIVAVLAHRSVEMIISILGILKAGGAYLPIDPDYPQERVDYMLYDSSAKMLLTTDSISAIQPGTHNSRPGAAGVGPADMAYIIYTSGSTGRPKGVIIEHRNIKNLVTGLKEKIYDNYAKNLKVALTAPFVFDGSIKQIFAALLLGHSLYIVPEDTRMSGDELVDFHNNHGIDISDATPTHLHLMMDSGRKHLGLRHLLVGGEALTGATVERFRNCFGADSPEILNIYGPTECCVDSVMHSVPAAPADAAGNIPIGAPMANQQIHILDRNNNIQPIGVPGELCISGANVGRGYSNQPGLTAEKFIKLNRSDRSYRIYKTGDLARWLPDGLIQFLGRIDRQVKIRGFRVELEEVENRLMEIDAIVEAVVTDGKDESGGSYLSAYLVLGKETDLAPIRGHLAGSMPDYMIPNYIVPMDRLPLTSRGKVNYSELPAPGITPGESYTAPRNELEKMLAEMWTEALGLKDSPGKPGPVDIDHNFFHLGGHSLKAIALTAKIHNRFNVKVPLSQVFKSPTIRELAQYIKNAVKDVQLPITPVPEQEAYELSFNQKRLWIINQLETDSLSYNLAGSLQLDHTADTSAVKKALEALLERHESLRTGFREVDGEPVQFIEKGVNLPLQVVNNEGPGIPAVTAFELNKPPLLRVTLVKTGNNRDQLVFNMHHIISDGWSMSLLKNEFNAFYQGFQSGQEYTPEPLRVQYKDCVLWQNSRMKDSRYRENAVTYWQQQIESGFPKLQLPSDYLPVKDKDEGGGYRFQLDKDLTTKLEQLAAAHHTTLFTVMFSAYNILLSFLSGQKEIVCSVISAGRDHIDMHNIVGFFINAIPVKHRVEQQETFGQFLEKVNRNILEALDFQDYPVEWVLDELNAGYPELSTAFNMINSPGEILQPQGASIDTTHIETLHSVKFDMAVMVTQHRDGIDISWNYKKACFRAPLIEFIARSYRKLLEQVIDTRMKIDDLKILETTDIHSRGESVKPANDFTEFKKAAIQQSVFNRFEEMVNRYPGKIAVNVSGRTMSYATLNRFANSVGHAIKAVGEGKSACTQLPTIALLFGHGFNMIVGIFGALKAGKVYVPLDPTYPVERLLYILEDSGCSLLITEDTNLKLAEQLKAQLDDGRHLEIIDVDTTIHAQTKEPGSPDMEISPDHPAYILYTSGSTGKPKGVVQNHRNVLHFARVYTNALHIHAEDRLTLFSFYGFDAAKMDIYGALLNGAALYPYDIKQEGSLDLLPGWLAGEGITIFHSIPTVYRYFIGQLTGKEMFPTIRFVVMGGEAVFKKDVDRYKEIFPDDCIFVNGLGPTESTVTMQYFMGKQTQITREAVPVGYAVDETQVYLLSRSGKEARIFEVGEIVFKSDYLALEYLNNSERTREVFTKDPLTQSGRVYLTGDLGRRLADGSIEYVGRKDFQAKIRGFRVELAEIEGRLDRAEGVKKSVVVVKQNAEGENYLVAFYIKEPGSPTDENRLVQELKQSLPDYMIPNVFYKLEVFPQTATGKVDRKELSAVYTGSFVSSSIYAAPDTLKEAQLVKLWQEVLKVEPIGIDDNFFVRGGNSLKAVLMSGRIHKALGIRVPLANTFEAPTIRQLASRLEQLEQDTFTAIEPEEQKEYYPLSSAQSRLYFEHLSVPDSTIYNLPSVRILEGDVDMKRMESAFTKLIQRHESLRTSFVTVGDRVLQKVIDPGETNFTIHFRDTRDKWQSDPMELASRFFRPFDLEVAPLLRVGLYQTGDRQYFLMTDLHHIISDGLSNRIMLDEFQAYYQDPANELPRLKLQYKDFSLWQHRYSGNGNGALKKQETYWLNQFNDHIPKLHLPVDYPAQENGNGNGNRNPSSHDADFVDFKIESPLTTCLGKALNETGATLFMYLLAVYNVFLSKLNGQEDIVVGSTVSGRRHPDLQNIIGLFVNMLPIRSRPKREKTFVQFLAEVKASAMAAFENQDYQYDQLVKKLNLLGKSLGNSNSLMDAVFTFQNIENPNIAISKSGKPGENGNFNVSAYKYKRKKAAFNFHLIASETGDAVNLRFEYSTELFKRSTVLEMAVHFTEILEQTLDNPDVRLNETRLDSGLVSMQAKTIDDQQDFVF